MGGVTLVVNGLLRLDTHTHTHLPETGAAVTHNEVCDCVCVCAVLLTQWEPKAD